MVGRYRSTDPVLGSYLVKLGAARLRLDYHSFPQRTLFDLLGIRTATLETALSDQCGIGRPAMLAHAQEPQIQNKTRQPVPLFQLLESRSSTLRKDSGNRTYISTTRRMTSGDEFKQRNGRWQSYATSSLHDGDRSSMLSDQAAI